MVFIKHFMLQYSKLISKVAFKYKDNDFALWVNGIEVGTDNLGTTYHAILK
jgi:hypothetical protein